MTIKLIVFAAIQVTMYLLVAYITWDLTWIINLDNYFLAVVFWLLTSVGAFPFFIKG